MRKGPTGSVGDESARRSGRQGGDESARVLTKKSCDGKGLAAAVARPRIWHQTARQGARG